MKKVERKEKDLVPRLQVQVLVEEIVLLLNHVSIKIKMIKNRKVKGEKENMKMKLKN